MFQFFCLFAGVSGGHKINFTISPNVSKNGNFFTKVNEEKNITVCYEKETGKEIWTINEINKNIYISNDGKFGIGIYKILNFKKLNDIKDQTAIVVFKNGEKIKELKVKDILKNASKGKRKKSEFYWGKFENIFEKGFIIKTTEEYKVFNFNINDFVEPDDEKNFTKWKYEELLDYSLRLDSLEIYEYYNFMEVSNLDPPENKISLSYIGMKNGGIAAPAEEWDIDENGYLLIGLDGGKKQAKVLKKIYLDENNSVAYLVKNNMILRYKYNIREW